MDKRCYSSTVEGTGSAINVECGFEPSFVALVNIDGGADTAGLLWMGGMADASAWKFDSSGPAISIIASNGITPWTEDLSITASDTSSDGNETSFTGRRGFTIGADTDVNVSGETIAFVAMR